MLTEIRLPRTLLALLVGGTLGLCGAALQGLLRNPLAEPGLLGASSGAAFGAVLVFYFGLAGAASLAAAGRRRRGLALALAALYALAGRRGDFLTIVLAGIAINAFAAALTSLALNFAPSPYAALEILFWMLGSLADRSLAHVSLALPLMVPGWLLVDRGRARARRAHARRGHGREPRLRSAPHAVARDRRHGARGRRRGRGDRRRRLRGPRRAALAAPRASATTRAGCCVPSFLGGARARRRSPTSRSA